MCYQLKVPSSMSTIKILERNCIKSCQWIHSCVFIASIVHISHLFFCFYFWLWARNLFAGYLIREICQHYHTKITTETESMDNKVVSNNAKRWISKRVLQESKPKFSKKTTISYPLMEIRGKICSKFDVLYFLITPALSFALLPYYQRSILGSCLKLKNKFGF